MQLLTDTNAMHGPTLYRERTACGCHFVWMDCSQEDGRWVVTKVATCPECDPHPSARVTGDQPREMEDHSLCGDGCLYVQRAIAAGDWGGVIS